MTILTLLAALLFNDAPTTAAPPRGAPPPAAPAPQASVPDAVPTEPEEWVAEFIEYRALPELGQITISDGVVRGRRPVEYLRSHAKQLAGRGIFACTDRDRRRTFRRVDDISGQKFETLVVIAPPSGDGADWTRRVTVLVDGRKKLDCSLGNAPDGEVFVYGVTIFPDDGTIQVAAVDADGFEVFPPQEFERIDDAGVITDESLLLDITEPDAAPRPLERA